MRPSTLVGLTLFFLPTPASAQKPLADVATFRRPTLAADADTNSWQAYYDYGVSRLRKSPDDAEAAFVWATRIDPTRAEPLFGRWVTYWRRNKGLFKQYLKETPSVMTSPQIMQVESLHVRALQRNPFAPPVLAIVLYERLGDWAWSYDEMSNGLRAYSAGNYGIAADHFRNYVAERDENYWARYYLALTFVATRDYDRAADQISALLATQGRRMSSRVSNIYESQEMLQYGLGLLHLAVGDTATARANFGQALTENLAFYPAHAVLGDLAFAGHDSAQTMAEYELALELRPDDGVLRYRYARLLAEVGRVPDAEIELRRAIALEPFFAPPYLGLALVLDNRGNRVEALEQYRRYVDRTFRADPRIEAARQRITALSP